MRISRCGITWCLALVTGALVVVGCAQSRTWPTVSELREGLTVLRSEPAWAVDGAYRKDQRAVYFETRVGPLKPEVYREAFPEEPAHEMDARFVDENGFTFYLIRGGDTLIDPSWGEDIARGHAKARPASAQAARANYELALEASEAIRTKLVSPELKDHVTHLAQMGREGLLQAIGEEPPTGVPPAAADTAYYASNNYHYFMKYQKCTPYSWLCLSHHTGLRARNCSSSSCTSWDYTIDACNHGTCPGGSGMSAKCSRVWGPRDNVLSSYYSNEASQNTTVTGACLSGYNWYTPPGHDCNSDGAYEMWQIKNNSAGTSTPGTGGDGYNFCWKDGNGNEYACECDLACSGGCDGDWTSPQCPAQ